MIKRFSICVVLYAALVLILRGVEKALRMFYGEKVIIHRPTLITLVLFNLSMWMVLHAYYKNWKYWTLVLTVNVTPASMF
jgi:hypothetical protein